MVVLRPNCFFIFLFSAGSNLVSSKCNVSSAAKMEEQLRELYEIPLHNLTLYDGGDLLKWNCSKGNNQSSSPVEERAESSVKQVAIEESPTINDDYDLSSTGNSSNLDTFVLVYKNIFHSKIDEAYAPSSNVPVQVDANITSEKNNASRPSDLSSSPNQLGLEFNMTKSNGKKFEPTSQNNLEQVENNLNYSAHNEPVTLLLGEKHGITFLNVSFPKNSRMVDKTGINVFSVDYKFATGAIYFAGNEGIRGTGEPRLAIRTGVDDPVSLAVDWVHDRIYWMSTRHQTVEVAELDGGNRTLLIDNVPEMKFPNNIVVDPYKRLIFFVANNTIYKSGLEGTNLTKLDLQDGKTKAVRCLTLDSATRRLFFTGKLDNVRRPYIASSDYDGNVVQYLDIGNLDWVDVYGVAVFRDVVYFAHYAPQLPDSVWYLNTSWAGKRPVKVYDAPRHRGVREVFAIYLVHYF